MTAPPPHGASARWALRRRCPACGARVFDGWFRMLPVCPGCSLLTDRGEPDYFLGAVLINLVAAELVPLTTTLGLVVVTWPRPPWTAVLWGGLALAVIAPVVGYPFSKTLWLYADLHFREPVRLGGHEPAAPGPPGRSP